MDYSYLNIQHNQNSMHFKRLYVAPEYFFPLSYKIKKESGGRRIGSHQRHLGDVKYAKRQYNCGMTSFL